MDRLFQDLHIIGQDSLGIAVCNESQGDHLLWRKLRRRQRDRATMPFCMGSQRWVAVVAVARTEAGKEVQIELWLAGKDLIPKASSVLSAGLDRDCLAVGKVGPHERIVHWANAARQALAQVAQWAGQHTSTAKHQNLTVSSPNHLADVPARLPFAFRALRGAGALHPNDARAKVCRSALRPNTTSPNSWGALSRTRRV